MSDPNRTQAISGAPTADPNRTIMGTAPSLNATATIKPVQCPVCKSFNPPGLMFCNECGLIFEKALDGDAFGAPSVQLPVLVEEGGKEHQVRPGEIVIGRQGDILIEDTRISRRHAKVISDADTMHIEDMGSTNGTKVNGNAVAQGERAPLAPGDSIELGGFKMTLRMPGEAGKTQSLISGRTAALSAPPAVAKATVKATWEGGEQKLTPGRHSLGRRDSNDITIPDGYVSGSHGEVEVTEEGIFFTDLGSSNGTFVNDVRLQPNQKTKVGADDVIRVGNTVIDFENLETANG